MSTPSSRAVRWPAAELADDLIRYVAKPLTANQLAFAEFAAGKRGLTFGEESERKAYLVGAKAAGLWERYRAIRHAGRVDAVLAELGADELEAADDLFVAVATSACRRAGVLPGEAAAEQAAFIAGVEAHSDYSTYQAAKGNGSLTSGEGDDRVPLLSDLTDRAAVEAAVREFDRLGRDEFLAKYGYGPARTYFLVHAGRRYDSKAIAGAAMAHQPGVGAPLTADKFSGGEAGAVRQLRTLGFTVHSTVPAREIAAEAVRAALAEYDALGREEFLRTHNSPPATTYILVADGREYDAKPIVQAAWNLTHPSEQPLQADDFRGDRRTIAEPLRQLGFWVERADQDFTSALEAPLGADPSRYLAAAAALDGVLDVPTASTRRRERDLLCGALGLFAGAMHACGICGRVLPNTLLVAGHIKPRSHCTRAERLDLMHVAMPVCLAHPRAGAPATGSC